MGLSLFRVLLKEMKLGYSLCAFIAKTDILKAAIDSQWQVRSDELWVANRQLSPENGAILPLSWCHNRS